MARPVAVAIVGAGFGGVAAGVALQRAGRHDYVIVERGDRVGGVWCANTYPGLACDVPSHLYSFSFAPNPRWSRRYSPGAEIRDYLEAVARDTGVLGHVRFGAEVERAEWDDDAGRWRLAIAGGEELEAEVLITACGQLSWPAIPELEGLDRFAGPMFHSARWAHDVELRGKRIAVIGSGASAIQFVPQVADDAAHVTVFQRSAPWILSKPDRAYPPRVVALHERFGLLPRLWRAGWRLWFESLVPLFTRRPPRVARATTAFYRTLSNLNRFVQLRGDRRLLRATRPDYPMGGKRILVTSDWYPALRRPDVELVTERIERVVEDAVLTADGRRHPADVLVFGTGFAATRFLTPMEVVGRDGTSLSDAWRHGAEAYLGITVPRFPNLFLLYGPHTNHGTGSIITVLEAQAHYAAEGVRALAEGRAQRLEVRPDVHAAFQREMDERLADTVWAEVPSWYVNAEGRVTNNWPGNHREYCRRTRRLDLGDYLTAAPRAAPVG